MAKQNDNSKIEIARQLLKNEGIPEERIAQWTGHPLGLHPISAAMGASDDIVREQAGRQARRRSWAVDLGHFATQIPEEVGLRLEYNFNAHRIAFERRPQSSWRWKR